MVVKEVNIHPVSMSSVYIEAFFNEHRLASATGFFCDSDKGIILFTNRHVVRGKDNFTDVCFNNKGAVPNKLKVTYNKIIDSGSSENGYVKGPIQKFSIEVELYKEDDFHQPLWLEHPVYKEQIDVVGLVIPNLEVKPLTIYIDLDWYRFQVDDKVSVIGYPFGLSAQGFAIWSSGYYATDPDIDYKNLPVFLVDCRSRQGQSGSPVMSEFRVGSHVLYEGQYFSPKIPQ